MKDILTSLMKKNLTSYSSLNVSIKDIIKDDSKSKLCHHSENFGGS